MILLIKIGLLFDINGISKHYLVIYIVQSIMKANSPKVHHGKRYSEYNEEKMKTSNNNESNSISNLNNSKIKTNFDEHSFVFSLNSFEKNPKMNKTSSLIDTSIDETQKIERQSFDEDEKNKRNLIYASQSFHQNENEDKSQVTVKNNNDIFSLVFLNKSSAKNEPKKEDNIIKLSNFQKQKIQKIQKIEKPQLGKKEFGQSNGVDINDFEVGKKLGAGKFGCVFLARHKDSGFFCALKKISKLKVDNKLIIQLIREIKIQTFLNHPNIVKMYGFFSDQTFIYLAMELCYSGQLYNYLKKKRRLQEDITRNILQQICRALDYMHENQIIHRDLKPENIIYQSGLVKLCDFGWSISTNTMRGTFCGTPLYVSPELLKRQNYNNKIDVWSIGILTYELLFGRVPFQIQTEQDFIKIVQDEIKFSKITKISDQAKDFILNCLQKDPRDRYTIPQLLEHPFLNKLQNPSMADMY